jgi:hypothetical protein
MGVPIFIEVADVPEAKLCEKVVQALMAQKIEPVGYATHMQELLDIMTALKDAALEPSIFIVNTFKAKEIIPKLDPILGETPAIFLRRGLYAGQSGLMQHLVADDKNRGNTMTIINKMTPRLTSVWTYGAKNVDQVVSRLTRCTIQFAADNDFRHYEMANKVSMEQR